MTPGEIPLQRALQLSLELLAAAESSDVEAAVRLDAERSRLLGSIKAGSTAISLDEQSLLQQITALNDRAIGYLQHHLHTKARQMDTATVGRRAIIAYSTARLQR